MLPHALVELVRFISIAFAIVAIGLSFYIVLGLVTQIPGVDNDLAHNQSHPRLTKQLQEKRNNHSLNSR